MNVSGINTPPLCGVTVHAMQRRIDIVTCQWLSPQWAELIRAGYHTALLEKQDGVAVMWRGEMARDYVRNVMPGDCR